MTYYDPGSVQQKQSTISITRDILPPVVAFGAIVIALAIIGNMLHVALEGDSLAERMITMWSDPEQFFIKGVFFAMLVGIIALGCIMGAIVVLSTLAFVAGTIKNALTTNKITL